MPLRVTGALDDVAAVAATPVQAEGKVFRLGDIATVRRGFEDPPTFLIRSDGTPAVLIGVVAAKGSNILHLGDDLARAVAEYESTLPAGFTIRQVADQPTVVASGRK